MGDQRYQVNKAVAGYYTAADAKTGENKKSTVKKGDYYVYKRYDGMINVTKQKGVPGSWINPNNNVTTALNTFRIRVTADELWYYNKPDWNAREGIAKKGEVFTVVDTLTVNGSKMYKLKSGKYITANPQYIEKL
ncbi:DUF5776 domain-containing protein [Lederbergia wuyishanensis]|nr:DUF5776 domain-containing protein [Lederbergia wuyishanensis]